MESKQFPDIIEYYYTWKKYCSDEYRGRNRHISEEVCTIQILCALLLVFIVSFFLFFQIFSDEDEIYAQIPSSSSSGSGDSSELGQSLDDTNRTFKSRNGKKNGEKFGSFSSFGTNGSGPSGGPNGYKVATSSQSSSSSVQGRISSQSNLPVVYAPHTSPVPASQQLHHPCKYPGCNQVS